MFSYYGSKCKIAKLYPKPKYDLVIEPFAGAGWYSMLYSDHQILLNEKYDKIYNIWKWLIKKATKEEILCNIDFSINQDISQLDLSQEHRDLIGFCINRGSTAPRNIVQKWSCQVKKSPNWASTPHYRLTEIANSLEKIRHFNVKFGSYHDLNNVEATWFIDPPYQVGGEHYVENKIDYKDLSDWCISRKGQIIVCENLEANWLKFQPLITVNGQRRKNNEAFYTNIQ